MAAGTRSSHARSGFPITACAVALAVACTASAAHGEDFTFSGVLAGDNDVALIEISVDGEATVTAFTSSARFGGFDPNLSLFGADGRLIVLDGDWFLRLGYANDPGPITVGEEVVRLGTFDAYIEETLPAGRYTLAVSQAFNEPNALFEGGTLADGFLQDDAPSYNDGFNGGKRSAEWRVHILGADEARRLDEGVPAADVGVASLSGTS